MTLRWRDRDSNPRSPAFETALFASAPLPVPPERPTRFCEGDRRFESASLQRRVINEPQGKVTAKAVAIAPPALRSHRQDTPPPRSDPGLGRCNVVAQQARQDRRGRFVAGRTAGLVLRPEILGHFALQVSHLVRQAALAERARQAFLDRAAEQALTVFVCQHALY